MHHKVVEGGQQIQTRNKNRVSNHPITPFSDENKKENSSSQKSHEWRKRRRIKQKDGHRQISWSLQELCKANVPKNPSASARRQARRLHVSFALTPNPLPSLALRRSFVERLSARSCEKISTSIMCPTYVVCVLLLLLRLSKEEKRIKSNDAFRLRKTARVIKRWWKTVLSCVKRRERIRVESDRLSA